MHDVTALNLRSVTVDSPNFVLIGCNNCGAVPGSLSLVAMLSRLVVASSRHRNARYVCAAAKLAPKPLQQWLDDRSRCATVFKSIGQELDGMWVDPSVEAPLRHIVEGAIRRLDAGPGGLEEPLLFPNTPVTIVRGTHKHLQGVIESTTPTQVYVRAADGDRVRVSQKSIRLERDILAEAMSNLAQVVGIPEACVSPYDLRSSSHAWSCIAAWADIRRGKVLFYRGLGGFDIGAAYAAALGVQQSHLLKESLTNGGVSWLANKRLPRNASVSTILCWLEADGWFVSLTDAAGIYPSGTSYAYNEIFRITTAVSNPRGWLVAPHVLQAHGYFPVAAQSEAGRDNLLRLLRQPDDCPQRQQLLNHREYWDHKDHCNALDELIPFLSGAEDWPEGGAAMKPWRLLNQLREKARYRLVGPDVKYSHLDDLQVISVGVQ